MLSFRAGHREAIQHRSCQDQHPHTTIWSEVIQESTTLGLLNSYLNQFVEVSTSIQRLSDLIEGHSAPVR